MLEELENIVLESPFENFTHMPPTRDKHRDRS
jgi:hypothetical protein